MGKDYKERAIYAWIHDTGRNIPRKLLYRIKRKWWRHNYDIGEMRAKKKNLGNNSKINVEMFELKTKQITRWGLTIRESDVYFPTKENAIKFGRLTLKINPETKMFEEYSLWDLTYGVPQLIDRQRFDRTILIQ